MLFYLMGTVLSKEKFKTPTVRGKVCCHLHAVQIEESKPHAEPCSHPACGFMAAPLPPIPDLGRPKQPTQGLLKEEDSPGTAPSQA